MSYAVVLIQFLVCLLVEGAVTHFWPASLAAKVLGMLAASGLLLMVGDAPYRVEIARRTLTWPA